MSGNGELRTGCQPLNCDSALSRGHVSSKLNTEMAVTKNLTQMKKRLEQAMNDACEAQEIIPELKRR